MADEGSPLWRKSSFSGVTECVEVRRGASDVLLRDSKNPAGDVLAFTSAQWRAFIEGAKAGDLDGA